MKVCFSVTAFTVLIYLASAATKIGQLVKFHPITRAQYETILDLTDGKRVVSEGRLISSGVPALKGLATGLAASWIAPTLNTLSNQTSNSDYDNTSYPLCTIETSDITENGKKANIPRAHFSYNDSPYRPNRSYQPLVQDRAANEDHEMMDNNPYVVYCIVVVKRERKEPPHVSPPYISSHYENPWAAFPQDYYVDPWYWHWYGYYNLYPVIPLPLWRDDDF